jgi:hypothetical protein
MAKHLPIKNSVYQLKAICLQTGSGIDLQKTALLKHLSENPPQKPSEILIYHDCLLAMLAYPTNRKSFQLTCSVLNNLVVIIKKVFTGNNYRLQYALSGSGISGSIITGSFSFAIAKWLVHEFPGDVEMESSLADAESVRLLFREILPRTEYENIFASELNLLKRTQKLKGKSPGTLLNWLIQHIDDLSIADRDKESIFHNLQIFISWRLSHPVFNRTMLRIDVTKIFYHKEIKKKADINKVINRQLPGMSRLTEEKKSQLISTARAVLVFLHRETEPFTYADPEEITCFELERGLTVVLYGMSKERRLSIESYIGYLAFKNGIPVAYGGGWIFGHRCQFGINILPAFRGGESALVFYQLLRVYKQRFGVNRFVVKPYQFGKDNKEALESGAFWFYYRAGFRPENETLKKLASDEWSKISNNRQYRTPVALLKKFILSNLELEIAEKTFPRYDAALLSIRITDFVNEQFQGKRNFACAECIKQTKKQLGIRFLSGWHEYQLKALKEWSLLAQALLNPGAWTGQQKKQFIELIKAKGGSVEMNFIQLLQQHQPFWKDTEMTLLYKNSKKMKKN